MLRWIIFLALQTIVVSKSHRNGNSSSSFSGQRSVLITGGCGFVGRHFTRRFCDLGWEVVIVDNMISESALSMDRWPRHLVPRSSCDITFFPMDCREYFSSSESRRHFSLFLHLAAVVGGRANIEGSPLAVADDLSIDSAAFLWAVDKIKPMPDSMIYFSSSAAYPIKLQSTGSMVQLTEDMINLSNPAVDIAKPDLTYGWAKLTGEYLAQIAHKNYGLNVSIYRPMSGYGEDQHKAYPFTSLILKGLRGDNPIHIWSDAVRDFMHIEDVVNCVFATANKIQNAEPVNLGTGIATSFTWLAKAIAKEVGYSAEVTVQSGMPLGVQYRVGNVTLLRQLGCKANTSLEAGIRKAIRYHRREATLVGKDFTGQSKSGSGGGPGGPEVGKNHTLYSSIQCIAGNHKIDKEKFFGKEIREFIKFPLVDPQFRTCKVRNLCWNNGRLTYYEDPALRAQVDSAFLAEQINGLAFYLGAWSPEEFYLDVKNESVPDHLPFDNTAVGFLDAHSNSYNYGHYILDNVFPHFVAAKLFDVDFLSGRQVFESSCKHFGINSEKVANKPVPFNASMGSYRSACLEKLNTYWPFFFEKEPLYLEPAYSKSICFDTMLIGQGSTFGLKSADPSRGAHLREFRDLVIRRVSSIAPIPLQIDQILVGERSAGHSGGVQFENLCQKVSQVVDELNARNALRRPFSVRCIVNQDLSFIEEVQAVQQSKILISVQGTISYMSLFSRDNTQQIALADKKETRLKEHNVLMYGTHFNCLYLMWDEFEKIAGLIILAARNLEAWRGATKKSAATLTSNSKVDLSKVSSPYQSMRPAEGTLIKSAATGSTIFLYTNGTRCRIVSAKALASLGLSADKAIAIADYELADIPVGMDISGK